MVRDAIAVLVLALQLPIPLFWLVVHPAAGFWQRHRRACYCVLGPAVWLAVWLGLYLPRDWWLEERFSRQTLVALLGMGLMAADVWLLRQVVRQAGWRVIVGLPELSRAESTPLVSSGIYGHVRHPRYLGMMLAWLGAALLSGATRLLVLVAGAAALAVLVTELEEQELEHRLGSAYRNYRQTVPRFLPRLRFSAIPRGGER